MRSAFASYMLTALRSFRRHRGNAILNIVGLAVGLASSALILLYVQYELSYDTFHEKADRIYRVYKRDPGNVFIGTDRFAVVPAPLGPAMVADFPEVESAARFTNVGSSALIRVDGKALMESGVTWAEPSAFTIFDIPLVHGDPATALSEPNTAVISEEAAMKHFGTSDPVGRVMRVRDAYDMRITGVMQDIPRNSHIKASVFMSFVTYEAERKDHMNWGNSSYHTYVLLKEGARPDDVRDKLGAFTQTHMGELFKKWEREEPTQYFLQPLTDVHLGSSFINFGPGGEGDIRTIYILSALAVILLATASINYMNLATARATLRAREVGIRKVIGAGRPELIRQFIGESVLTSVIAGILALLFVNLTIPSFATLVERELTQNVFSSGDFVGGFLLITLLVGFVSGAYPAFVLSGFSPLGIFKAVSRGRERLRLRDALVVVQFAGAIGLAICAITILDQLDFIRSTDPGYNRDQVLSVRVRHQDVLTHLPTFRDKVNGLSGVEGFALSTHLPMDVNSSSSVRIVSDEGQEVEAQSYQLYTDESFLDVYRIPLKAGRYFSGEAIPEDEDPNEYVVNEAFARTFGLKDPVGKEFTRGDRKVTIIGVMKDFHIHSFRQEIAPLMVANRSTRWVSYISIRVRAENMTETVKAISAAWSVAIPDYPIDYAFVDETFDRMYDRDLKLGQIVTIFTALALFIGGMGLFGLATFVAQVRRKEIGIRKVLGASSSSVAMLLSRQFLILVAIANLIAWPAAYVLMEDWLSDFSYRIALGPSMFVIAGFVAAMIALLTVNIQAVRAARANPVESLRYE